MSKDKVVILHILIIQNYKYVKGQYDTLFYVLRIFYLCWTYVVLLTAFYFSPPVAVRGHGFHFALVRAQVQSVLATFF